MMYNQKTMSITRRLILFACVSPLLARDPSLAVFYDSSVPQIAFGAAEVVRAGGSAPEFALRDFDKAPCTMCVVVVAGQSGASEWATLLKVSNLRSAEPQSYAIRRGSVAGRDVIAILGADAAGAMYGALDVAEAIRLKTVATIKDSDAKPHIAQRGIKFNIPLDVRTPSYSDNSDAAQANIPEMWSFDFWREFIDDLARHRYNVLSLWNLHPFPSLVRVPEFPDVALTDVQRTKTPMNDTYSWRAQDMVRPELLANTETVKRMSMDDKIRFWRDVMRYAHDRGVDVYVITWNLYTFGAEGKHGITTDQTNPKTLEYFRASVRELVLTYPLLKGIGITAGENMNAKLTGENARERWLWKAYGEGVQDALKLQPGRTVRMIHRYHEAGQEEIMKDWKAYTGPFDLSFKYSVAHMYSIPNPPFINDVLPTLPAGRRTWLTVRNDDVYSFRWGNPAYARAYIKNIPGADKIAGFYMGPDGYIWGREFLSTEPDSPRQTVLAKQWYSFMLWGRLAYNPELPDELFRNTLAYRFPAVDSAKLSQAWADASQVFPLITRFFWGDIDLKWYPEGSLSHPRHKGYYTVRHFVEGESMPGSGVLNIRDWYKRNAAGDAMTGVVTPLQIADQLESHAAKAMASLKELQKPGLEKELRLTLGDIEAMSHLANYYAAKIRGAAALAEYDGTSTAAFQQTALSQLEKALGHWKLYAAAYSRQYTSPHLYNRVGVVDIPGLVKQAAADVEIAKNWNPSRGQTTPRNAQ
jgi:hypothetical protein